MSDTTDRASVTFWGVRGSTPCANKENMEYGGNTTCVQINVPGSDDYLILDSGTGIRNLGNKIDKTSGKVSGRIFITHPHWDHIQGFPFFKPIYGSENQFEIHMPVQENGGCKEVLSGHLTKTFFPVTLDMIDAHLDYVTQQPDEIEYDGYSMEFMFANHPVNTAIYKIRIQGKTIIFCPDNEIQTNNLDEDSEFYNELEQFFRDADILIHDAQYDLDIYPDKRGWGHSAWQVVLEFAKKSNVKNVYFTHHDPDSTDQTLASLDEKLQKEYCDQFDSIQLAKEGMEIKI